MESLVRGSSGEVNEVTPRAHIDSGAIGAGGPKEAARALELKETVMSNHGVDFVAASGGSIKTYGEKKVVGYADDGDGVSMKIQRADVKKVSRSVHKVNLGGNVVVLGGKRSYTQNKETGKRTRIGYEDGQFVMRLWLPATREEPKGEVEKALKGNRFAIS
jgi:hypothetical protein